MPREALSFAPSTRLTVVQSAVHFLPPSRYTRRLCTLACEASTASIDQYPPFDRGKLRLEVHGLARDRAKRERDAETHVVRALPSIPHNLHRYEWPRRLS